MKPHLLSSWYQSKLVANSSILASPPALKLQFSVTPLFLFFFPSIPFQNVEIRVLCSSVSRARKGSSISLGVPPKTDCRPLESTQHDAFLPPHTYAYLRWRGFAFDCLTRQSLYPDRVCHVLNNGPCHPDCTTLLMHMSSANSIRSDFVFTSR